MGPQLGPQVAGLLPDTQTGVAPSRSVEGLLSGAERGPGPWLRGSGTEPGAVSGSAAKIEVCRPGFGGTGGHVSGHVSWWGGVLPDGVWRSWSFAGSLEVQTRVSLPGSQRWLCCCGLRLRPFRRCRCALGSDSCCVPLLAGLLAD